MSAPKKIFFFKTKNCSIYLFIIVVTLIIAATIALAVLYQKDPDLVVTLPSGLIRGREATTAENVRYFAFEKVPYAAAPINSLRFKPPQPPRNWSGVLNTTHLDVECYQLSSLSRNAPQMPLTQSEDCLFLNIFTPKLPTDEDDGLPVMVYLHGGSFSVLSSSSMLYPPDLFMDKNVLLVTINFRLGLFGFLSTHDHVISGNYGLKDQHMALQWIKQNIKLFGGDPKKVIIFGNSSGAACASYHLLQRRSKDLFRGVIMQSGTFLSTGMFERDPRRIAFGVGAILNSTFKSGGSSQQLYDFLRKVDAATLNSAADQFIANHTNFWDDLTQSETAFAPVIEANSSEAYITEKMYKSLKAGRFLQVPAIMGLNSEEQLEMFQDPVQLLRIAKVMDQHLDYLVPSDMPISDDANRTKMGRAIRRMYTQDGPFSKNLGDLIRYSSDNFLTRPTIRTAELYSHFSEVYFYVNGYDGRLDYSKVHYEGAELVGHAAELKYLFCRGADCNNATYPESDLRHRRRLLTLWTNFAKYLKPTPTTLEGIDWPSFSQTSNFSYLNFNDSLEVRSRPKWGVYTKWLSLYDSLKFDDYDTF